MAGEECANLGVKMTVKKRPDARCDAKFAAGGKTLSRVMPGSNQLVWLKLSASQVGS